jgi:nitrate reductase NapE component
MKACGRCCPAVVATTMTAVAVLVVVLVPVATVAVVATAGWVRWRGGWWSGCPGCSVGVERRWGS